MTRKQRFKKLGWRTEKVRVTEPQEGFEIGEWLGFWRLVSPNGSIIPGWHLPDTERGEKQYQANCFDGEDEAWAFPDYPPDGYTVVTR